MVTFSLASYTVIRPPLTLHRDRDAIDAAARVQKVAQQFSQALAQALSAGVTSGPHKKRRMTENHGGRPRLWA